MKRAAFAVAFSLLPVSLSAQWLSFRTPGIPRTADDKPHLSAPAPSTSDGKSDLSGLWRPEPNINWIDVIQDPEDESIFRPEAESLFQKRVAENSRGAPLTNCLPLGPAEIFAGMYRIIQSPNMVAILYEGGRYRQIFMDGRALPKDPNPTWMGYSIGHWDEDTLVVETSGFTDSGWLDQIGHPRSESLRVTERFRRVDFGHMRLQVTFDDPVTLIKPLNISLAVNYSPDTSMIETVCNEDERDTAHLVSHVGEARVQVRPAILAKYAGNYQFRQNSGSSQSIVGRTATFTLHNGHLYLKAFPLIPRSETEFDSYLVAVRFFSDANGAVTHVILS